MFHLNQFSTALFFMAFVSIVAYGFIFFSIGSNTDIEKNKHIKISWIFMFLMVFFGDSLIQHNRQVPEIIQNTTVLATVSFLLMKQFHALLRMASYERFCSSGKIYEESMFQSSINERADMTTVYIERIALISLGIAGAGGYFGQYGYGAAMLSVFVVIAAIDLYITYMIPRFTKCDLVRIHTSMGYFKHGSKLALSVYICIMLLSFLWVRNINLGMVAVSAAALAAYLIAAWRLSK